MRRLLEGDGWCLTLIPLLLLPLFLPLAHENAPALEVEGGGGHGHLMVGGDNAARSSVAGVVVAGGGGDDALDGGADLLVLPVGVGGQIGKRLSLLKEVMRQKFPTPPERVDDELEAAAMEAVAEGLRYGMDLAKRLAAQQCQEFTSIL